MVSKRRARIAPTTEGVTPLGATRGGVKDATEPPQADARGWVGLLSVIVCDFGSYLVGILPKFEGRW